MNLLGPESKLYALFRLLMILLVVNLLAVIGLISILGFSLAMQCVRIYIEKEHSNSSKTLSSIKQYFVQLTPTLIFKYIALSVVSFVLVGSSAINFLLLNSDGYIRFIYLIFFVFVIYTVINLNLNFYFFLNKKMRISQMFFLSGVNFPKFLFFLSLISGVAYLLIGSVWVFFDFALYIGTGIYISYMTTKKTVDMILSIDE